MTENNCTNKIVLACRQSKKLKKMHVWLFCKNTPLCTNYYFLSHQLQKCNFSLLQYCLPQYLFRSVLLAVNWVLSSYLNYFTVPWCSGESQKNPLDCLNSKFYVKKYNYLKYCQRGCQMFRLKPSSMKSITHSFPPKVM